MSSFTSSPPLISSWLFVFLTHIKFSLHTHTHGYIPMLTKQAASEDDTE